MNPGLVVKLRPSGPWRVGTDSGARNRVDAIYHSDSLYSAVTAAMLRLGWLEEWLDATARAAQSAVRFSSCFPFQDGTCYVVPPRTLWPPASPGQSGRIRWKSARFVPLGIVQVLLAGQLPDESRWSVDGTSECLVPAGQAGPFRTSVRWMAAVDRLTGASERHSAACLEFREGAGLWTVVSFADDDACERWRERVKTAFRVLADTGFGGERSRGWGRSDAPEFVEGVLPGMILPGPEAAPEVAGPVEAAVAPAVEPLLDEPADEAAAAPAEPAPPIETVAAAPELAPPLEVEVRAPDQVEPMTVPPGISEAPPPPVEASPVGPPAVERPAVGEPAPEEPPTQPAPAPEPEAVAEALPGPVTAPEEVLPQVAASALETAAEAPPAAGSTAAAPAEAPGQPAPAPEPEATSGPEPEMAPDVPRPHWLLGLFAPSPADAVDWSAGNYTIVTRCGRVESPAASGDLKKHLNMVTEGSVLYASPELRGGAPNVAPDGFPHPVFRAGFAVAITLGGGNQ